MMMILQVILQLIFPYFLISSDKGVKVLELIAPPSITTWHFKVISINDVQGVDIANPASLKVSQPFSINLNLPQSVLTGEIVTIPAAVLSHLKGICISVSVYIAIMGEYVLSKLWNTKQTLRYFLAH